MVASLGGIVGIWVYVGFIGNLIWSCEEVKQLLAACDGLR